MHKLYYLLAITLTWGLNLQAQSVKSLENLLNEIKNLNVTEQNEHVISFIESLPKIPLVEGGKVVFLVKSAKTEPVLLADFNGFLNTRYVEDKSLGQMFQLGQSDWYYFEKLLVSHAVINYKYKIAGEEVLDPLNNHKRDNFGEQVSVIYLDSKQKDIDISDIPKGKVIEHKFESGIMNHKRDLQIYLPVNYKSGSNFPTVYFHDGIFHLKDMEAPVILDQLIHSKKIVPIIAVFDNPVIRGKEYRGNKEYLNYIEKELVPYIDQTYSTLTGSDRRAVIGFSRGGMSALYVSHNMPLFSKVGVFSPAIHPASIDDFMSELNALDYAPEEIFITGSQYDFIWYPDAVKLNARFKETARTSFKVQPMGHNISSWQHLLDDMLIAFFGY